MTALTRATVACQHALFTSAARTLTGPSGYGVVAMSPGWGDAAGFIKIPGLAQFLPQGKLNQSFANVQFQCLARYREVDSSILIVRKVKAGADQYSRPGNFLVHALRDPDGALSPAAVIALWTADVPYRTVPNTDGPRRDLEPVLLAPDVRAPHQVWDEQSKAALIALTESVLALPRTGRPVGLQVSDPDLAASMLMGLFHVLPEGLAGPITFSTFEQDPGAAAAAGRADVIGMVPGACKALPKQFQQISLSNQLVHDSDPLERAAAVYLVEHYLEARAVSAAIAGTRSTSELLAAIARETNENRPLQDLSDSDVLDLITHSGGWLTKRADRRARFKTMLASSQGKATLIALDSAVSNGGITPAGRSLGEDLLAIAIGATLDNAPQASGVYRHAAHLLGCDTRPFSVEVAQAATVRLRDPRMKASVSGNLAVAEHVQVAYSELGVADQRLWAQEPMLVDIASRSWTDLSVTVLTEFLVGQVSSPGHEKAVELMLAHFPDQSATVLQQVVAKHGPDTVLNPLARATDAIKLCELLLACPGLPAGYVLRTVLPWMGSDALESVQDVLDALGPELFVQDGLDPLVIGAMFPDTLPAAPVPGPGVRLGGQTAGQSVRTILPEVRRPRIKKPWK